MIFILKSSIMPTFLYVFDNSHKIIKQFRGTRCAPRGTFFKHIDTLIVQHLATFECTYMKILPVFFKLTNTLDKLKQQKMYRMTLKKITPSNVPHTC